MRRALHAWLVIALFGACALAFAQQDSVITQRVSSALGSDATLKHMRISVATQDGVVHLTGFVNSMAQVERAAAVARLKKPPRRTR